ncbi:hypothetical protein F4859DRAFT_102364 [Xylaria cf. heliscus]|nr:hypothetical protein F4859DRAFT_102364 [Xylaria cf. heliscus]
MEVIGLVAAIPGLIEITQKTIAVIQVFIDQKPFVKRITELLDQLEWIEKILQEILNRLKSSTIHHSNFNRLTTVTQSLKGELIALGHLFQPLTAGPNRKAKALSRVQLLIHGLEGKIKKCHERLDDAKSSLMLVIVAQNEAIVEESLTISRSNLRLKLNDILLPCGYNFIPQNLQGTCEWIWSHPMFCKWQQDPNTSSSPVSHEQRIMCIYGPKGCGKSVLAASIVQKLKSQANFAVGFSFWAGSHNQQKLLAFLSTFLWHIIQQIPDNDLTHISTPILESIPLTEKTLEDVILIALKTLKSRVYCIIDGIDESVDDWARPDLGGLRLVLDLTKTHTNLRIVLLGRDSSMRSAISLTPLRMEITEHLIQPDINQLIMHHLDSSLKIQDTATRQLVQETLEKNSGVMILWVTFIFRELNRCQLSDEIAHTLQQVPRDLDREYHRLFVCLQDRLGGTKSTPSLSMERAKCLLSWIITAPEPLTYEELRCAFAISRCPDTEYEKYMISEEGIMDTCGDFIRISDGRYHIAHASIVEFLTRPIELWQYEDETIDYFRIDVLHCQSLMCLGCINYFQRTGLGYPLVDTSAALSQVNCPIFSCALKFALIYLRRTHASEHCKIVWECLEDFMKTPQFCSVIECGFLILQYESATSSEQHTKVLSFMMWLTVRGKVGQLPITLSLLKMRLEEELACRERIFGLDDDRFRTWKFVVDILVAPLEGGQITVPGLIRDIEDNSLVRDTEVVSSNCVRRPLQTGNVEARRAAEHAAMLKIGNTVAAKAPVIQAFPRVESRFTSIVPELLPIPFLIFLAFRETNRACRAQYLSSALKRLARANNLFEAYCSYQLGLNRYQEDEWDETAEGLLSRCRQIATNLPSSFTVDSVLCATLYLLAHRLLRHGQFLESQEIVSELQERLSNGSTKGYVCAMLEHKFYGPLFWDDMKAWLLADISLRHARQWTNKAFAKAISIVDSNIQLYNNPKRGRIYASIPAQLAKAEALYGQWHNRGGKIRCELAHKSEAACHEVLQLAKFPNLVRYIDEQWRVIDVLCRLLYRQCRHHEAMKFISRIPAGFPPTICMYTTISCATTVACLGDLGIAEAFLRRASLDIQDQQVSLLRFESNHISNLITALIEVRPIVQLWLLVSLCYRHLYPEKFKGALNERDYWYECTRKANASSDYLFHKVWDILYIRYLALVDYENGCTGHLTGHVRVLKREVRDYVCYENDSFEYEDDSFEYEGNAFVYEDEVSGIEEINCGHPEFASRCEELAFKYERNENYKAAAVVSRYLTSYILQKNPGNRFPWGIYYLALTLHFESQIEEVLDLCRFILRGAKNYVSYEYEWWSYLNIGILCFKIGVDNQSNSLALSVKFFRLAAVSFERAGDTGAHIKEIQRWLSASRLEFHKASQVHLYFPHANRCVKHRSCPDLRTKYLEEERPKPKSSRTLCTIDCSTQRYNEC